MFIAGDRTLTLETLISELLQLDAKDFEDEYKACALWPLTLVLFIKLRQLNERLVNSNCNDAILTSLSFSCLYFI